MSNPLTQNMLGDLPLITAQHFQNLGQEYWRERGFSSGLHEWGAPSNLERLQRLLHQKEQEQDVTEEDEQDNKIVLISKYKVSNYRNWTIDSKIPYHEDILPRWQGTFVLLFWLEL